MAKEKVKILVVDDHALMRSAVSDMLEKLGKFEIQTAESGFDAEAYCEEYDIDLVLMDIVMPEKDGIETTKELIKKHPDLKVLVLTGSYDKQDVLKMLEAGAAGYILKDTDEKELGFAIQKVLSDGYYFGSKPMEIIMKDFKEIVLPRTMASDKNVPVLTPREVEIVKYISKGMVNKEIAAKLFLSKRTVDKHRTNILQKLNMHNSAELIAYAVNHGIVD